MNRNQRQIRRIAARSKTAMTYKCHPQYDKMCAGNSPREHAYVARVIPHGDQPRKSKAPKVAGHNG